MVWRVQLGMHYLHALEHVLQQSKAEYILVVEDDAVAGLGVFVLHAALVIANGQLMTLRHGCWVCWMRQQSRHGATCRCGERTSCLCQVCKPIFMPTQLLFVLHPLEPCFP